MQAPAPYFMDPDQKRLVSEGGLPVISEGLDSVRAYQFEIHFELPGSIADDDTTPMTLAAKQVGNLTFATEAIEVNRVNDKIFYPGKASPEEMTVTFDNLYQPKVANILWKWFSYIYSPIDGRFLTGVSSGGPDDPPLGFKAQRATVVHLNAHGLPTMETRVFGVYPTSWKTAEFNYSTNEFHTIEMTFRFDFMENVTFEAGVGTLDN